MRPPSLHVTPRAHTPRYTTWPILLPPGELGRGMFRTASYLAPSTTLGTTAPRVAVYRTALVPQQATQLPHTRVALPRACCSLPPRHRPARRALQHACHCDAAAAPRKLQGRTALQHAFRNCSCLPILSPHHPCLPCLPLADGIYHQCHPATPLVYAGGPPRLPRTYTLKHATRGTARAGENTAARRRLLRALLLPAIRCRAAAVVMVGTYLQLRSGGPPAARGVNHLLAPHGCGPRAAYAAERGCLWTDAHAWPTRYLPHRPLPSGAPPALFAASLHT